MAEMLLAFAPAVPFIVLVAIIYMDYKCALWNREGKRGDNKDN